MLQYVKLKLIVNNGNITFSLSKILTLTSLLDYNFFFNEMKEIEQIS